MLSVVMSMSFSACSDDDDEPESVDLASVIVGTWEFSKTNDNGEFEVHDVIDVNSFRNGTFTGVYVIDDYTFKAVDEGGYYNWFEPANTPNNEPCCIIRAIAVSDNRIEWREYSTDGFSSSSHIYDGHDEFGEYDTWIWVRK